MVDLETLVIDHLRSFNEQLPSPRRVAARLDAVVIGQDAAFDSLDAVEFMMELEDAIAALIGRRVDVCRRIEQIGQDIVTVGDLAACAEQLLADALVA
jgi:acyl carrier protein